jgi:DNA-binding Lrp family transcriptional regulator
MSTPEPEKQPTFQEIAEALGIPPSTVKDAYARALEKIRQRIALVSEILGYESVQDYLDSGDDRIVRIEAADDGTYNIRIFRPVSTPEA